MDTFSLELLHKLPKILDQIPDLAALRVIAEFRAAGAVTPDTAQFRQHLSPAQMFASSRLVYLRVLKESPPDRFYLDEKTLLAIRREDWQL